MKKIIYYFKKDIVLTVSWGLAAASAFLVRPDKGYAGYIDWRSLGILWSLMIITKGYMNNGIFEKIGPDVKSFAAVNLFSFNMEYILLNQKFVSSNIKANFLLLS